MDIYIQTGTDYNAQLVALILFNYAVNMHLFSFRKLSVTCIYHMYICVVHFLVQCGK